MFNDSPYLFVYFLRLMSKAASVNIDRSLSPDRLGDRKTPPAMLTLFDSACILLARRLPKASAKIVQSHTTCRSLRDWYSTV
jgi:hypothetical protein